jgi:hypothetical protein
MSVSQRVPIIEAENYLVCHTQTVKNLKKCLAKSLSIVRVVELSKAEKRTSKFPIAGRRFFNPVARNGKVCVGVGGLPSITRNVDMTLCRFTLQRICQFHEL